MVTRVSWDEIRDRAARIIGELDRPSSGPLRTYGVPRGGCAPAAMIGVPVDLPCNADVIVDDVIDSGETAAYWRRLHPSIPFRALYDKRPGEPDEAAGWLVFPWEENEASSAEDIGRRLIQFVGEDGTREGLRETPARFAKAMRELTEGYRADPSALLSRTFDGESYDQMVLVRDVPFWSLCEHHLLPFQGSATVGYIPGDSGRIVGLSKIPRVVHAFARRLQVQERLTQQIAHAISDALQPAGVGVLVTARHSCLEMRGARTEAPMTTSHLTGVFRDAARNEFLHLAGAAPARG